jgi:hypothetical protein
LNWAPREHAEHAEWVRLYRSLLALRAREIAPRLAGTTGGAQSHIIDPGLLSVRWTLGEGSVLHLTANLDDHPRDRVALPEGRLLYSSSDRLGDALTGSALPPWTVVWTLGTGRG